VYPARVPRARPFVLALLFVVAATADGSAQTPPRRSLAGRLLVATDAMNDTRFVTDR